MDKSGDSYFEHCHRVARDVDCPEEKAVAYLHDVVEKTRSWSIAKLRDEGFSPSVLQAVDAMTRAPSETDNHFLRRAMSNRLAMRVKLADLKDNITQILRVGGDPAKLTREFAFAKSELTHHP